MELNKILDQIKQDQPNSKYKTTIKPNIEPTELRTLFIKTMREIVLKRSNGEGELVLNGETTRAINIICQYINNEAEFLQHDGYSFNKGLWLYGKFGSGKTILMLTYQEVKRIISKADMFTIGFKTCVEMNQYFLKVDEYTNKIEGEKAIQVFANRLDTKERIFDDLGEEEITVQNFGNKFCVMQHILSERHKGFPNVKTHITTNLTKAQIGTDYGGRIDSRAFEMFNFIVLGAKSDSVDFRKQTK